MITESEFENLKIGDKLLYVSPDRSEPVLVTVASFVTVADGYVLLLSNKEAISKVMNDNVFLNLHDALKVQNCYLQNRIAELNLKISANQQNIFCKKNKYMSDF